MSAHDDANERLRTIAASVTLARAADAFLASLGTRNLVWRRALAAKVMSLHLPAHAYVQQKRYTGSTNCAVCGFSAHEEKFGVSPGRLASALEALGADAPQPTARDLDAFAGVLRAVLEQQRLSVDGRVRRSELAKSLSPVFRSSKYERMDVLDDLGRASVLATTEAPGFLRRWVSWDDRADGSGNNEFAYPFALWTAAHGFDAEAVRELFPRVAVPKVPEAAASELAPEAEARARGELLQLSAKARPATDRVAEVIWAPGGVFVARLEDGRFALCAKVARRWRWTTGTIEEVVASLPEAAFTPAAARLVERWTPR